MLSGINWHIFACYFVVSENGVIATFLHGASGEEFFFYGGGVCEHMAESDEWIATMSHNFGSFSTILVAKRGVILAVFCRLALVNPDEVLIDGGNSGGLNMVVLTTFCSDGLDLTWWWFHSCSSANEAGIVAPAAYAGNIRTREC